MPGTWDLVANHLFLQLSYTHMIRTTPDLQNPTPTGTKRSLRLTRIGNKPAQNQTYIWLLICIQPAIHAGKISVSIRGKSAECARWKWYTSSGQTMYIWAIDELLSLSPVTFCWWQFRVAICSAIVLWRTCISWELVCKWYRGRYLKTAFIDQRVV
jgi:hypothetical protein